MSVPQMKLTERGSQMATRALAGETLTFTTMEMGDGTFPENGSVSELSGLLHTMATVAISKRKRRGENLTLSGVVVLPTTTPEFEWRELGLFARIGTESPGLYAYVDLSDDAETVKPDGGLERSIYITVAVGDAPHVEVELSPISTPEVGDLMPEASDLTEVDQEDKILISDTSNSGIVKFATVQSIAAAHGHPWNAITGKPSSYPPSEHDHKPESIGAASAVHFHAWNAILDKPVTYPPAEHTHGAGALSLFDSLLSEKKTISGRGTYKFGTEVDLSKYDILMAKVSGSLTNGSSKYDDLSYSLGGDAYSSTFASGVSDGNLISHGSTKQLEYTVWFFRAGTNNWYKSHVLGPNSGGWIMRTSTPLTLDIGGTSSSGAIHLEVFGLRAEPAEKADPDQAVVQLGGWVRIGTATDAELLMPGDELIIVDDSSAVSVVDYQDLLLEAQKAAAETENTLETMAVLSVVNATNLRRTAEGLLWTTDTLADFRAKLTAFAAAAVTGGYVTEDGKCSATWAQAQAWLLGGGLLSPLDAEARDYPWRRAAPKTEYDAIKEELNAIKAMLGQASDQTSTLVTGGARE